MFTGLIAELGVVERLERQGASYHLTVKAKKVMDDLKLGDSIAVNGACLTVVKINNGTFTADIMPETGRMTINSDLRTGDKVNLERTLRVGDRLDGHIVTGHVEGVGTIISRKPEGIATVVTIQAENKLLKYILTKGSVAIDGVSLTVTKVTSNSFSVSLIPHTSSETTLGFKNIGEKVNLETDILGKYVERMLTWNKGQEVKEKDNQVSLDKKMLFENGFL